tara:strand:+ start:23 stop:529 length:507 start_codon:yes stop_codon:yes gene_type:complete
MPRRARNDVDIDALREVVSYDPETGVIARAGREITARWPQGYVRVNALGRTLLGHRVAWALHYGEWPAGHLDHINHDRADNRIANLRAVSHSENLRNACRGARNSSGHVGVNRHGSGAWRASIYDGSRDVHLGLFRTIEEACAARAGAEKVLGYHERHGETRPREAAE